LRTGNDPRSRPGTKLLPTGHSTEKASVDSKPTRKSSGRHGQPHEKRKPSGRSPPCPGAARNGRNRDPLGGGIRIRPERSRWVFPPPRSGRPGTGRGSFPRGPPPRHRSLRPIADSLPPDGLARENRSPGSPKPRAEEDGRTPGPRRAPGRSSRAGRAFRPRFDHCRSMGPRFSFEGGPRALGSVLLARTGPTGNRPCARNFGPGGRSEARSSAPEARALARRAVPGRLDPENPGAVPPTGKLPPLEGSEDRASFSDRPLGVELSRGHRASPPRAAQSRRARPSETDGAGASRAAASPDSTLPREGAALARPPRSDRRLSPRTARMILVEARPEAAQSEEDPR